MGPFFIEGVLGSKRPKNIGVDTFPDPVGHFLAPGGHIGLFRGCGVAGGERVPLSPRRLVFVLHYMKQFRTHDLL